MPVAVVNDDLHRIAFNAAFSELQLRWHWDSDTYRDLMPLPTEKERIRIYLETRQPHALSAFDPEFLVDAIHAAKARWYQVMARPGGETLHSHEPRSAAAD
jgi:hypothetical protein